MALTEEKEDGKTRVVIDEELSIYAASALREGLLASLENEGGVMVDLAGVTVCDAAGIQLLLAFWKSAERMDKPVRLVSVSKQVLDTLAAAGFDPDEFK
jgi:phospholipid transport system transporter-binding protein